MGTRSRKRTSHLCLAALPLALLLLSLSTAAPAAPSRMEELHGLFPAVRARFASGVPLVATSWRDGARVVEGFRARAAARAEASPDDRARVRFPGVATDPFVVEGEGVRVVLRDPDARDAPAQPQAGALLYPDVRPDTDAWHVPTPEWTEEYLHLRSPRAPRKFSYEVVEAAGVASVAIEDGLVYFRGPDRRGLVALAPVVVDAAGRRSAAAARWALEDAGPAGARRLVLRLDPAGLEYPLLVDPTWITTGSLGTARGDGIGILLNTGMVLVMGNAAAADLYDPATGVWKPTAAGWPSRGFYAAVLLRDGRVLACGGVNFSIFAECRTYDPIADTWAPAASMSTPRENHTLTLLGDGRVLAAGGWSALNNPIASAEIYDPAANTWAPTGSMTAPTAQHSATLLRDGRVLVAGGTVLPGPSISRITEIYDPGSGAWTRVGDLVNTRYLHSATLLPDGRVLAAGGSFVSSAEVFDPGPATWSATTSLPANRSEHSSTLLPEGMVLVAGGGSGTIKNSTLLYDPVGGSWSAGPNMSFARYRHASTMLPDGRVLVAGGFNGPAIATAELLDIDAPAWSAGPNLNASRSEPSLTLLENGRVLAAGGVGLNSADVYDPGAGTWTPTANTMSVQHWRHTATLLGDGRVLVAGSIVSGIDGNKADLYDPATNSWSPTASMSIDRFWHTATLLPCGEVLVAGGQTSGSAILSSAERYNPKTGTWRPTGSLVTGRWKHTATLLADGRVLVTGGVGGTGELASAELYDPATETWTPTAGPMTVARYHHLATLLPNGRVLTAGGFNTASAEIFNPATGTFTATGSAPAVLGFESSALTLLPNGRVLAVGGFFAPAQSAVYDPVPGTWSAGPAVAPGRDSHAVSLLLDGRVLVAGGNTSGTTSALYDVGRGESPSWRPVVATASDPLVTGTALAVTGTGFTGLGEGTGGLGYMQSATNYPLVQLRRLDNDEVRWLPVDPAVGWSSTGFRSLALNGWFPGPAIATVFTSGIPSVSKTVTVECPPAVMTTQPVSQNLCALDPATLTAAVSTSFCETYQWYKDGAPIPESPPFSGTQTSMLTMSAATAGAYRVDVSLACSSAVTSSASAVLTVDPPLSVVNATMPTGTTVCRTCLGGTATESHAGGGAVSQQWGYRTTSGGVVLNLTGRTGPSYTLNGSDFPADGSYFIVVTTTPACGSPIVSNEIPVTVTSGGTSQDVLFFTVTSRSGENVLEWLNPPANGTVSVKYTAASTTCTPPATESAGAPVPGTPFAATAGVHERLSHPSLVDTTQYCYTVFYDAGSGYGTGRSNSGRPFVTTGAVKWSFSTGVFSTTPPTVGGAGVIVTSNDGVVHALARGPAGGEWAGGWTPYLLGLPAQSRSPVVPITVATKSPVVYLGSQDGNVYALAASDGTPLWTRPLGAVVQAAPAGMFTRFGGDFDYLLVGTRQAGDNLFYALDPSSGSPVPPVFDNSPTKGVGIVSGAATVDYASNRVYFASRAGASPHTLWALNLGGSPTSLSLAWTRDLGDIDSSPVLRGGRVYVGSIQGGGTLRSIDADNVLPDRAFVHGDGQVKGFVFPDRTSPTGDLYFSTNTRVWVAQDSGGTISPKYPGGISLGSGVTPSTVLYVPGADLVYVGGSDGRLYRIDTSGASPVVTATPLGVGGFVVGAPSLDLDYGLVVVGTEAGVFYAVDVTVP